MGERILGRFTGWMPAVFYRIQQTFLPGGLCGSCVFCFHAMRSGDPHGTSLSNLGYFYGHILQSFKVPGCRNHEKN